MQSSSYICPTLEKDINVNITLLANLKIKKDLTLMSPMLLISSQRNTLILQPMYANQHSTVTEAFLHNSLVWQY